MAQRPTPMPLPPHLRDDVALQLGDREMLMLDDNARFIVRQMVANAYAAGFADGRQDERTAQATNDEAKRYATELETKK